MQHVLSQLITKRTELKSEMNHLIEKANDISNIIESLDVSIKVFDPEFDLEKVKDKKYRKKSQIFKHGEANKLTLDVLRKTTNPLTLNELAIEVIKIKNLDSTDLNLCKSVASKIRTVFYNNDLVEVIKTEGNLKRWKIA